MAYRDQVRQSATVNGTGAFTLGAAVSGYQTINAGRSAGDTVEYRFSKDNLFESGIGTLAANGTLTRAPTASSNGGALVNFTAGAGEIVETAIAQSLNDFGRMSQAINMKDLATAGTIPDTYILELNDPSTGFSYKASVAALRTIFGGTGGAVVDSTAPTFPDALTSSSVTQTSFTLGWSAGSDANGISKYEWSYDGTTWTSAGTALSVAITGRTAATTYTMRVRAVDPSGNPSPVRTLPVTTLAGSDTVDPVMSGSMTFTAISASGYTMNWPAGTDNVGVDHYESSIDNGATWQTHANNVLSRVVVGATAATTYNPRVRAHDAAGRVSNVLTAPVTTSAATLTAYTITTYGAYAAPAATIASSTYDYTYGTNQKGFTTGKTGGAYWNVKATTGGANAPGCAFVWHTSGTVAPTTPIWDGTGYANGFSPNYNGTNPNNTPIRSTFNGNAFTNQAILWVPNGSGTTTWYLWAKPDDDDWKCLNPSGMTVTGS